MSNSYTNVTVEHDDAEVVGRAIVPLDRFTAIAPAVRGRVVVYDRESETQDYSVIESFAGTLSEKLNTVALAVMVRSDSVLCYWLFDRRTLLDFYMSKPLYFGEDEDIRGGDSKVLATAWSKPELSDELEEILHRDADPDSEDKTYVFETDRHYDIVKTLQLPDWANGHGYSYLADGMFPDGFVVDDSFHTVGNDCDE